MSPEPKQHGFVDGILHEHNLCNNSSIMLRQALIDAIIIAIFRIKPFLIKQRPSGKKPHHLFVKFLDRLPAAILREIDWIIE